MSVSYTCVLITEVNRSFFSQINLLIGPGYFISLYTAFYQSPGGNLNRTATITYQQGGEVTITQRYFGQSVQDNIRMETYINGTVPEIDATSRITVDDYSEEYRRVGAGVYF